MFPVCGGRDLSWPSPLDRLIDWRSTVRWVRIAAAKGTRENYSDENSMPHVSELDPQVDP
jgi:hypothetical protein